MFVTLLPALFIAAVLGVTYQVATAPVIEASTAGLIEAGGLVAAPASEKELSTGLIGVPEAEEQESGVKEPPAEGAKEALPAQAKTEEGAKEPLGMAPATKEKPAKDTGKADGQARLPVPAWLWLVFGVGIVVIAVIYGLWNWERLEVFKRLLASFFPLALLILAVLGSIVFGLSTPSEAAAVGAFGGFVLAAVYRFIDHRRNAPLGGSSLGRSLSSSAIRAKK